MESSIIILQGYLRKHTGGIFFATKKRWATLTADGFLSLSKRPSQLPYNRIQLLDFTNFNYADDNLSLTFDTVEDGVLVRAIKFYCVEPPTFDEWVRCIQNVRDTSKQHIPPPTRRKFLKEKSLSMKALFHYNDDSRDSLATSDLAQIDPVLKVQAGGEAVAKSGFVRKRGGAKGGSRAFKKRWFVVTHFGRVLYFKTATSSTPLGQFSLIDAKFDSVKENEVSIITESRTWELLFESEREKMEWMVVLNRIVVDLESEGPIRTAGMGKKIHIGDVGLHPRNVSLIQKSTLALGFQADESTDEELNRINGITRRISGRKNANNTTGKWEELSVACVTWNLSESLPKMTDIRFLRRLRSCHVVAIGVQECQSVIYHSFQSDQLSPVDIWLVMVKSAMGDGFALVASRAMGAIHLCVFVRNDILDCVSNVSTTYVPCGIGNVMYNKGAVGVRMNFYDTSVAFICAHLAANKEKVQERSQDFHRIASVIIESIGKSATQAKMAKERHDDVRESETIDLDFCSTRFQQRRSTFVEAKSNPLIELAQDEDIQAPDIRVKSSVISSRKEKDEEKRPHSTGLFIDTGDRLAREFDRCFFFGDLNYRLEADKLWTQTLLSMSDKMVALQEEEERFQQMQQYQDAITGGGGSVGSSLSDASTPSSPHESLSENTSSPALRRQVSRESDLSRRSQEVAKTIDKVVDNYNASFRMTPDMIKSMTSSPTKQHTTTSSTIQENDITLENIQEDQTLQMLMNLIPTCEYESDDDEDDGEIIQIEEITTENEVENLFKAFEDASTHMNDILDERVSQFIASVDDSFRSSTGGASVRNNPRTSLILTESQHDLIVLNKPKPNLLFGSSFRKPQPLLTSNSKSGLEFFMMQTGFTTPDDIFERLLQLDQLKIEKAKGTVLAGFEEGKISFKPSYKFDPFTETYDTSKKSRTPAWCDRIFYSTPRYGKEIELQTYECIHGEFHSDHRAVIAVFKIKV